MTDYTRALASLRTTLARAQRAGDRKLAGACRQLISVVAWEMRNIVPR